MMMTAAIAVMVVTWGVWSWRDDGLKTANEQIEAAESKRQLADHYLQERRADVEAKKSWLMDRNPSSMTLANASSMLLNRAQKAAAAGGVRLDDVKFLDVVSVREFDQARMSATISDTDQKVHQVLMAFHDPEQLQVVRSVRIQPHKKEKGVIVADVEFRFYYHSVEASDTSTAETPDSPTP